MGIVDRLRRLVRHERAPPPPEPPPPGWPFPTYKGRTFVEVSAEPVTLPARRGPKVGRAHNTTRENTQWPPESPL